MTKKILNLTNHTMVPAQVGFKPCFRWSAPYTSGYAIELKKEIGEF